MITLNIKPLSVNSAWQGKRFKSKQYKEYEEAVLLMLPAMKLPPPPYRINFEFGFSNVASDLDNPVKPALDLLQKKYGFNDKHVMVMHLEKKIVSKGKEYIKIDIQTI